MGPSASEAGTTQVTGTTTTLTKDIATPTSPTWAPGANPGGIPQNYTASSNVTLPGGTYWFTSLSIAQNLAFSGPATVYVNGDVNMTTDQADLLAYNSIPANLKIFQIGSGRTFAGNRNDMTIIQTLSARLGFYGTTGLASGKRSSIRLTFMMTTIFADETSSGAGRKNHPIGEINFKRSH